MERNYTLHQKKKNVYLYVKRRKKEVFTSPGGEEGRCGETSEETSVRLKQQRGRRPNYHGRRKGKH